jgi:hypothetical protein
MPARLQLAMWYVVFAAGCVHTTQRAFVVPSLQPVDSARPRVVFSQVQGNACGPDALLGALRDMKRLEPIDGYLEVVVQETEQGERLCAKSTGYPFRYGTDTSTPRIVVGPGSMAPVVIAGRSAGAIAPSGSVFDCPEACQRYAALVEAGSVKVALARDRCEQRCRAPDPTFQHCLAQAHDTAAAQSCGNL